MNAEVSRAKQPPYQGVDRHPEDRPGVPRETRPHRLPGAHWSDPDQQPADPQLLGRLGLPRVTPVFSTALPPRGVSGVVRRVAHRIPDHRVSHWVLLMLADRIDVIQNLLLFGTRRAT
jgi:hypothetical protein